MASRLHGIAAIGFDLDNTLYDRDAAMSAWLKSIFPDNPGLAQEAIQRDNSGFIPRRDFYVWLSDRVDWARGWRDVEVRYQEEVLPFIAEDAAITEAIRDLALRYRLGILTNGGAHFQRLKFGLLKAAAFFAPERVFVSGEIGHDKPDARAFLPLMAALDADPEQILFVGDNPDNDIQGAAAHGMKTCWIRLAPHHMARVAPDLTLASVAELPAALLG